MEVNFANGSVEQKSLWREALHKLLHFPFDELPLTVNVSFVDPGSLAGSQTSLAETTWSYDSNESATQVRNDAPGFAGAPDLVALAASMGLAYDATKHFHETSAHETGHSLFASLPQENRIAIAKMFGAKSDDVAELFPESKRWEDRIGEAIAETFKEAFLPRRFRVFPNRTNIHISYDRFPEFRHLFRVARTVREEKIIKPNEPFPAGVKGSTIGYRFPFAPSPWFYEFPIGTKPPVDVQFEAWEVRFVWRFKKWFTNEAGGGKTDETTMVVELIQAFDEQFIFGGYSGSQTWFFATVEQPDRFHFESSHITLFDENEAFKGGRWQIFPGLPEEPFFFSGQTLSMHSGGLWVPPMTFGEDFTVPNDNMFFHWEGGSFIYCGTRVAAGQSPGSFPAIFRPAYPKFMLDGADLFRMGGFEPPDTPVGNKGIESYRISDLEPSPPEKVLERASVYNATFSLPTKELIVPGEEEDRQIAAPGGQLEPTGSQSGRRPVGAA